MSKHLNIKEFKITYRGYVIPKKYLDSEELSNIIEELTIEPLKIPGYAPVNGLNNDKFYLYKENDLKLYVPRYYGIQKLGLPSNINLNKGLTINCKFNGNLRDYQKNVIKKWTEESNKSGGGGIIAIRPGGGKTVISIAMIAKLGLKTIILVHTSDLLNQWKERLEMFLPDAKIGIIRGKICNTESKDVVIGMIQSLSDPRKDNQYPESLFKDFGLLIVDECHHIGAKTFSRCLNKIQTRYIIGLSATPNRQDGLTRVIKYYMGDICFDDTNIDKTEIEKQYEHIPDAEVILYNYKSENLIYNRELLNFKKKPDFVKMESNIIKYELRNKFIISLLPALVEEGRNILLITSRRDHVADLMEEIINNNIATCGPYVGSTKQEILNESKKKQILIGTYKMVGEGFDCSKLDTLILASPKKSLRQIAGRIMRKEKHKRDKIPLIIDICDNFSIFKNWSKLRQAFYNYYNYRQISYSVYDIYDESKNKQEKIQNKEDNKKTIKHIENKIEKKKEYIWPIPVNKRPKSLPDLKKGSNVSDMIKNITKSEDKYKYYYDLS